MKYRAVTDTGKRSPLTESREELDRWSSDQVMHRDAETVWQYAYLGHRSGDPCNSELVGRYERPECL